MVDVSFVLNNDKEVAIKPLSNCEIYGIKEEIVKIYEN